MIITLIIIIVLFYQIGIYLIMIFSKRRKERKKRGTLYNIEEFPVVDYMREYNLKCLL